MLLDSALNERAKLLKIKQKVSDVDGLTILNDSSIENFDNFARDVLLGLKAEQKFLLPKYFYDQTGSDLFVQITQTDEYYPTRTEKSILSHYSAEITEICNQVDCLVELGSGSSEKTDTILAEFHKKRKAINYIPIDVSDIIISSGRRLLKKYDRLSVTGILSDYKSGLSVVSKIESKATLVLFLGSSIGNFEPLEIEEFLITTRQSLNPEDFIIIGFDLIKDRKIMQAAYNDNKGITRAFNLNILERINRELHANFELTKFDHSAFYNEKYSRIEMHLVSKENQTITIDTLKIKIPFKKNESIHTENSYKFSSRMIELYANKAKLEVIKTWKDPNDYFALCLLKKRK